VGGEHGTAPATPAEGYSDTMPMPSAAAEAAPGDDRVLAANDDDRAPATHREGEPTTGTGESGEQRGEGGRRRGRGGRGGRDRGPREGALFADSESAVTDRGAAAGETADGARRADDEAHEPIVSVAAPQPLPEPGMAASAADRADAWRPAAISRPPPSEAAAPRAMPRAEPTPLARAEPYALPVDSLAAVAESAGLQWVNSDVGKIEAAQAAMAATPASPRLPREVVAVAAIDDGPLVMVETKKDLAQVKLPFETTAEETQGL
jgi:ribonuclease E